MIYAIICWEDLGFLYKTKKFKITFQLRQGSELLQLSFNTELSPMENHIKKKHKSNFNNRLCISFYNISLQV